MKQAYLIVTMPDQSRWAVPVAIIAQNRATHYAHRTSYGSVHRSLIDDTLQLFASDPYEIHDWAANNMNWSTASMFARRLGSPPEPDFQEGWCNGDWEVADLDAP